MSYYLMPIFFMSIGMVVFGIIIIAACYAVWHECKRRVEKDRVKEYEMNGEPVKIGVDMGVNEREWECFLFGVYDIRWYPQSQVPNAFWRWMQFICFGNRWVKRG